MNDTDSATTINANSDKDSDCWQVALNEIACTIKRINPHNCIFDIKEIERISSQVNLIIGLLKYFQVLLSCLVILVQKLLRNESLDDALWLESWLKVLVSSWILLTLNLKTREELLEVVLNGPLNFEISQGNRALIIILLLIANVSTCMHLSNDVTTLLSDVDA